MQRIITNENEWLPLAKAWAKLIPPGFRLYLSGELGAGKTTFTRSLLREWGIVEAIKSPTYTLVETYEAKNQVIHHFDLYRLQSPLELHYLGLELYFNQEAIVIVEWPEKGTEVLPAADMLCTLSYHPQGRLLHCVAYSPNGHLVLERLEKK